jgi:hypothetical protein
VYSVAGPTGVSFAGPDSLWLAFREDQWLKHACTRLLGYFDEFLMLFPTVVERVPQSGNLLDPLGFGVKAFSFGLYHFQNNKDRLEPSLVYTLNPPPTVQQSQAEP